METRKQDPDAIAEEAVGQRHGDPPPYAVKTQPDMSQEDVARQLSKPAGPQASIPEKRRRPSASESEMRMLTLAAPPREIRPEKSLAPLVDRTRDLRGMARLVLSSVRSAK